MKVIHLFNSSQVSGPENLVVRNLAGQSWPVEIWNLEESRKDDGRGNALAHLCDEVDLAYRGFTVHARLDTGAIAHLAQALTEQRPELVHTHDVKASVYFDRARRRLDRAPKWVSTHHGIEGRPDLKTRLYELYYRRGVLPRADLTLAVSLRDETRLRKTKSLRERVRYHRNGLEGTEISEADRHARKTGARRAWSEALGQPEAVWQNAKILGFVGRLSFEKDPRKALGTVAALAAHPVAEPWFFVVLGQGALEAELRGFVEAYGLRERVFFLGYRPDAARELAALDALLIPSRAEGLPLLLLEAGWSRVGVVAHDVGGIAEVIASEREGLCVSPKLTAAQIAGRVAEALANEGTLAAWGRGLEAKVRSEFSGERWREGLREFYRELGVQV